MLRVATQRLCLTLCVILGLVLSVTSAQAQQKSASDLFKEGNDYFQAGLYRKAIRAYKETVAQNPEFKEAWYNLGVSYSRESKFKEESNAYKKAIALDGKYGRAVFNLAIAQEDGGSLQDAISSYESFLSVSQGEKDQADACVNLGILYTKTGKYDDAVLAYTKSLELDPDLADANFNLGIAYGKMSALEKYKDRVEELRTLEVDTYLVATKQRPNHHKAWYNLAVTYNKGGELPLEIEAYRNAVRIKPRYPQALFNLAYALDESGAKEEALKTWEAYLEVSANIAREKGFLATAKAEIERLQKSVK